MTTTLRTAKPPRPSNGLPTFGLSAAATRQRRPAWIALGLLLVLGAGLGVALWSATLTDRIGVLVAARPIAAGERITSDHLREASVNSDSAIGSISVVQLDGVVGKVAQSAIPEGTPLQQTMLGAESPVPAGKVIVGSTLAAGEYPTSGLRAGDVITLVETTNGASASAVSRTLGRGSVWAVERVNAGGQERLFVSIVVDEAQGIGVANAAAGNRLRLLLGAAQ